MSGIATGVQRVLTDVAGHDVIMLLDVFSAPRAQVVINHRTRPFIPARLKLPRAKE